MDRDPTDTGARIEWAIAQSGRTLTEVADAVGVTHSALSQWKSGTTNLHSAKVGNVLRFCEATGVSMDWLLTGDGPRLSSRTPDSEPALVIQARHIVHDMSPAMAATAYRLLAALKGGEASGA